LFGPSPGAYNSLPERAGPSPTPPPAAPDRPARPLRGPFMSSSSHPAPAPAHASPSPPDLIPHAPRPRPSYWLWVLCLLGVDYFSPLAYQPSISAQVAGRLAPLATVVVVLVTLGCALPVYLYVAGRSAHGAGSIALLERLVHGWRGKTLVL